MSKDEDSKIGFGKYINAGLKRPKDKTRIERFWVQLPIEMGLRSDFPFKDQDELLVQLVGNRLIVTKVDQRELKAKLARELAASVPK